MPDHPWGRLKRIAFESDSHQARQVNVPQIVAGVALASGRGRVQSGYLALP